MSDARPEPAAPPPTTSLRQAASSAGLLVLVLVVLAWSRYLRSGPPEHRPAPTPPALPSLSTAAPPEGFAPLERVPDSPPPPPETPGPHPPARSAPEPLSEPAPPPGRDPALAALADRAAADAARLAKRPGAWTVQMSRHCSTPLVQDKVRRHGGVREFLLVPAEQGERACFVVCWGVYPDRAAAAKGVASVPAALKGDGKPFPRAAAEVLP